MSQWTDKILKRITKQYNEDRSNFLRADKRRNFQPLASKYWKDINTSKFFREQIIPYLPTETVWNPFKFNQDKRISPLSVQHLYHMFIMKTKSNFDIRESDLIVEVGPGFGNLCRLIHSLGFNGEYILIDFPEQLEIQKSFLVKSGVNVSNISFMPLNISQIEKKIQSAKKASLIGTFSISEMPMMDRKKIEPFYNDFNYIFIIYKPKEFDKVDNSKYFNELSSTILSQNLKVQDFKDEHYGSRFLIAKRDLS